MMRPLRWFAASLAARILGPKCPICLRRTHILVAHITIDHAGDDE